MASEICLRPPYWVGYGFVMWLCFYLVHRWQSADQPRSVSVHPSRWVVLLCGNPRRNGTVDVEWAGLQLTCFIPMVAVPLVCILGLPAALAVALWAWYPVTLVLVLIAGARARREQKRQDADKEAG